MVEEDQEDILKNIPLVDIDDGVFKYILIEATPYKNKKVFLRGYLRHEYHADNFNEFVENLKSENIFKSVIDDYPGVIGKINEQSKIKMFSTGGGRIEHSVKDQSIYVYGYSNSYGRGDHTLALELLKQKFSNYPPENFKSSNNPNLY